MGAKWWVHPRVIVELSGSSKPVTSRRIKRFKWPWKRAGFSLQKLYLLEAVERDLKMRFEPEEIRRAVERNSRVAGVFSE